MSISSRGQDWSSPPESILSHILSLLEPECRFNAAAVNSNWAQAAAVSTKQILCVPSCKRSVQALQNYLGKHGEHVTSLCFRTYCSNDRDLGRKFLSKRLPCSNLVEFEFGGECAHPGPRLLQAAAGLTRLSFDLRGEVPRSVTALVVLTGLTHLRSLQLAICKQGGSEDASAADQCDMDGAVLAQLPHLTQLQLSGPICLNTLRPISCLIALQELQVQLDHPVAEAADSSAALDPSPPQPEEQQQTQPLLQHLTALHLGAPELAINSCAIPWLTGLPLLRAEFSKGILEPQLICAYTQLTKLETAGRMVAGDAPGLLEFLSSLRSLQQLEAFSLHGGKHITSPQACRSLTAASGLKELHLSSLNLPEGCWQHMFPAGVQLGLTCLSLTRMWGVDVSTAEDLQRMVQCCPHLQSITLDYALHRPCDLQPLTQLSGLGSLVLGGILQVDDAADQVASWSEVVRSLAQLPALTNLRFEPLNVLSRTEMLQLTAVTGLSFLHMNCYQPSEQLLLHEGDPDGAVWYQLLLALLDDSACRDVVLQQEAAVMQQLQQGGQDPKPVELALQEARAREELARVQRKFRKQLKAAIRKYRWGRD